MCSEMSVDQISQLNEIEMFVSSLMINSTALTFGIYFV